MGLREIESRLPPGFRFHPSDEELVCYYLRNKLAEANHQTVPLISPPPATTMVVVDLHAREPWELPEVAKLSADEWYFFSFRDRKYATGSRTNRATKLGYWKATGRDRMIHEMGGGAAVVGMRKTLVFHFGRAPNGRKSGWVMHEFRLNTPGSPPKEDWVLCRAFHKGKGEAEQGNSLSASSSCINGPSSSSSLICSPPQRPAAASAVDKLGRRLMISSLPAAIHDDQDNDQLIVMHQRYIGGNAGSGAQLLDLAMLQAADGFLEFEQGVAAGVSSSSTMEEMEMEMQMVELESLATSCGVLQGGNYTTDGVYF